MRRKGFTLVELLVVISIIALLMAILMPALQRVKIQAKNAMCMANLRHWGVIWSAYTGDHDGYFNRGWVGVLDRTWHWPNVLRPYYADVKELMCCPMATQPMWEEEGVVPGPGFGKGPFAAWGICDFLDTPALKGLNKDYGSYGINHWVQNPEPKWGPYPRNWRTTSVKGAGYIPLFLDCYDYSGAPNSTDEPPPYIQGPPWFSAGGMDRFCIDRHRGAINGLFLDFSVREIGLKELWRLKWHREYDTNADPPVWPDWMKNLKDY
jgi:prepilin-type N-terminal cleavage/methylation domain-containing protein/prepilin-type processing-associated H-X9-DG protein